MKPPHRKAQQRLRVREGVREMVTILVEVLNPAVIELIINYFFT